MVVVVLFRFFRPFDNQLIDFSENLRCQPLAEIHHQAGIKWPLIPVSGKAAEELQIRVLLNLQHRFFIGITVFSLYDTCSESKAKWFCNISLSVGEKLCITLFYFIPWN